MPGTQQMGSGAQTPPEERITLSVSDGWIVAKDETTGVTSQGRTKADALANLSEALRLYHDPVDDDLEPREASNAPWF